ncbi:MAG TPA: hemerythrin domain-containing protein, partial [Burkholderiaceae bacterium]|nr:hemerythrin domain-containing protein [Burkholderiaceae bacterium]
MPTTSNEDTMEALSTPVSGTAVSATEAAPARYDIYAAIHKALRLHMADTLTRLGRTDPFDDADVSGALRQLGELVDLCEHHLHNESRFLHPALERARPGSASHCEADHAAHLEAFADLRDLAGLVTDTRGEARAGALTRLYRATARFVGHNFEHMAYEEAEHNAVLWAALDDAQILAIEQQIVSSIEPSAMGALLHWFLPALNAPERAAMLRGMQAAMPAPAFEGVLDIARA